MSDISRPLIQRYRPRSFRERGVVAPFTSPLLSGGRLRWVPRVGAAGHDLELVVPNPSGGKGFYILPWGDIGGIWRPTMHDVELGRVLAVMLDEQAVPLSPSAMRTAARQVAAFGLAGRAAADAAVRAEKAHADGLTATRFALLMRVTEQIEAARSFAGEPLEQASPAEIQQRGGRALLQLAANLGQPANLVDQTLDRLALHFVDIGFGLGQEQARLARLVADMAMLQHGLVAWAQTEAPIGNNSASNSSCRDAQVVATAAELAARMAQMLLDTARGQLADMQTFIRTALSNPAEVSALNDRPALLLDGWDRICLIWRASAAEPQRHTAVQEIVRQLPLLPDEAEEWLSLPVGTADKLFQHQATLSGPPRGAQAGLVAIARNETLRAMAG